MSWWTETRNQLESNLGLSSPADAVNTVGKTVANEVKQINPKIEPSAGIQAARQGQSYIDQAASKIPGGKYAMWGLVGIAAYMIFKKSR